MQSTTNTLSDKLRFQTDLCVKCGMCSSQCPTYILRKDENESPRGRISLVQALINDENCDQSLIQSHLDNCLSCLHCEKICPSKVPYREIFDDAQALLENESPNPVNHLVRLSNLTYLQWKRLGRIYRFAYKSGMAQVTSALFLRNFRNYLREPANKTDTKLDQEQNVQLFAGCLSNIFDQETQQSTIALLDKCGISVTIPDNQQCCGALAHHNKAKTLSKNCAQQNQQAFSGEAPVLFTTSGCGAYVKHAYAQQEESKQLKFVEAGVYLSNLPAFKSLEFHALNKIVLIHSPCSEKNDLKQSSTASLLAVIPDIQMRHLPETTPCCGASGNYMLKQPENAREIRAFTEQEIIKQKPDILVSTNYPCAMHIAAGLKEKGLDIKVMHPLSLLWKQLKNR